MQTEIEECDNCRFYKKQMVGREKIMMCKRYPPTVGAFPGGPPTPAIVGGKPVIQWEQWKLGLAMLKDDWCGEWKAKVNT